MPALQSYLGGLVSMGFCIAALFFFRFWRRTNDGLFAWFALAFVLFALNQAVISLGIFPLEQQSVVYLLRLAGYSLIIFAIVRKNVASQKAPPQQGSGP